MPQLNCTNRDGQHVIFSYEFNQVRNANPSAWEFHVTPLNGTYNDFFYFTLVEIHGHTAKVTMMNAHNQAMYSGQGIPEALIVLASELLRRTIISSTNLPTAKSFQNEYRTPSATRVWNRLMEAGLATFDAATDIFTYNPNPLI